MILTAQGLNDANTYIDPRGSRAIVFGPAGDEIRQQSSIRLPSTLQTLWALEDPFFLTGGARTLILIKST